MTLEDALDQVQALDDSMCIFARKPWALDADAEIGPLETDGRVPSGTKERGFDYFLEISVAQEVLEAFGEHTPSVDQRRSLLMYYAEHDAYPEWIYKL